MKKFLSFCLIALSLITPSFADNEADKKVVTSLQYVKDELNKKQDNIPAQTSGTYAVTYGTSTTHNAGEISPRQIKTSLGTNTSDTSLPTVGAVNTEINKKQDKIPAKDTNTVVTYTGTVGVVGEKGIYQDEGAYSAQMDNLVEAGAFNTAVKTGLDSEFLCAENASGGDCWLWSIHNEDDGGNLFDKNNITPIPGYFPSSGSAWQYTANGYSVRIPCMPNTTYTARYNGTSTQAVLSFASTSSDIVPSATTTSVQCTNSVRQNNPTLNTPVTITTGASDKWLVVQYNRAEPQNTDMADNLQVEKGSNATPYQSYTAPRPYTTLVPSDYTPIEYIETTGTQWIDTGIRGFYHFSC